MEAIQAATGRPMPVSRRNSIGFFGMWEVAIGTVETEDQYIQEGRKKGSNGK
jgi:hypothetical protein